MSATISMSVTPNNASLKLNELRKPIAGLLYILNTIRNIITEFSSLGERITFTMRSVAPNIFLRL